MTAHAVTLHLTPPLYDHFRDRAEQRRRSLEAEILEVVKSAVPDETLPEDLERELAGLEALNDDALWRVADSRLSQEESVRLEALTSKQKTEGLSDAEREAQSWLLDQYQRRMLLRATAANLLKNRGHDISVLLGR